MKKDGRYGYTLIEILVGISIVSILFLVGYAAFREFGRRQALTSAVRQIKSDLRLSQELALAAQKPTGCTVLNGYRFVTATSSYDIDAFCGAAPGTYISVKNDVALPKGVTVTAGSVLFKVLGQGTNLNSDLIVTLSYTGVTPQTITVTKGGEIK